MSKETVSPKLPKPSARTLKRQQLLVETGAVFLSTLVFTKLILFTRYPLFNIPIKTILLYAYSATLDPLVVYSGYKYTRFLESVHEE